MIQVNVSAHHLTNGVLREIEVGRKRTREIEGREHTGREGGGLLRSIHAFWSEFAQRRKITSSSAGQKVLEGSSGSKTALRG